jgi:hypothetical protein
MTLSSVSQTEVGRTSITAGPFVAAPAYSGHMYQVLWWPLLDVNQLRMEQVLLQLSSTILRAAAFISDFVSPS